MCDSSANLPLVDFFETSGYKTVNYEYPSKAHTIQEHAQKLTEVVRQHIANSPNSMIHFCAHSLGALILRAMLNNPACPQNIKESRAVLLGPPLKGTQWGRTIGKIPGISYFAGHSGQQLFQAHTFDDLGQFPDSMDVLVILGEANNNWFLENPNDGKVMHSESDLSTPHRRVVIPSCGHGELQSNPLTGQIARNFFDGQGVHGYEEAPVPVPLAKTSPELYLTHKE